jgi:hypothetical protein
MARPPVRVAVFPLLTDLDQFVQRVRFALRLTGFFSERFLVDLGELSIDFSDLSSFDGEGVAAVVTV